MKKAALLVIALFIPTTSLFAQSLSIQLGSDSARFTFATEAWGQQYGQLDLEGSFLYTEDDEYLASVGLLVRNDSLDTPVVVSVGTRLYYADAEDTNLNSHNIAALTIGIEALLIPDNLGGLGFGAHYFTGPSVVSFLDAEGFTEYGVRISYQITPQATLFLGYQKIEAKIEGVVGDVEIDKGGLFGVDLRF